MKREHLIKASSFYLTGQIEVEDEIVYDDELAFEKLEEYFKNTPKETTDLAAEEYQEWWAETLMDAIESLAYSFHEVEQNVLKNIEARIYFIPLSLARKELRPGDVNFDENKFIQLAEDNGTIITNVNNLSNITQYAYVMKLKNKNE
jgi:hypothetical protein